MAGAVGRAAGAAASQRGDVVSDDPKRPEERDTKVGTFMAPDGLFSVPLKTLSDEIPLDAPESRPARKKSWLARTLERVGHRER